MKKTFLLILLSQMFLGCVVTPELKKTAKEPYYFDPPRPSESQKGLATGNPVVDFFEIEGWTECALASITYEHNLEHKADVKPLKDIKIPKWGRPFEFYAFYYYEPLSDGYLEYYIVTDAYTVGEGPNQKCFDLVFEKPNVEKMCEPEKIVAHLKKWLLPNRVTIKDPQKIIKAAGQLPMTLQGCYEGKNLDIFLGLKQVGLAL